MSIRFSCPNCESILVASDDMNSEVCHCTHCQSRLLVPDPTQSMAERDADGLILAEEAPIAFGGAGNREEVDMDMTPMVDVTFLLLIFFMVTAAFSLQKSFQVPTPREERPSSQVKTLDDFEDDSDFVVIRIDENSTFYISAKEWDEEREAPSKQDLLVALTDARNPGNGEAPTRLLVVAHAESRHEQMVVAMDAGTEVGISDIKLVTVEGDS